MSVEESGSSTYFIYLPNVWQPLDKWLSLHPKYRAVFCETINELFYGNGPMAVCERHYVALMAASRHRCHFLMDLHQREYMRTGGEPNWLQELARAPAKIRNLDTLNAVLAHQPWSAAIDHLTALTKCASPDNWSLTELVQASIVLAQTHVLCSFILGNGAIQPNAASKKKRKGSPNEKENGRGGEVELLMKRMKQLKSSKMTNGQLQLNDESQIQKYFLEIQSDPTNDCDSHFDASSTNTVVLANRNCDENASLFTMDQRFGYVDFAQQARAGFARTHKIHDLSWEDQGYSCIEESHSEMADIIDRKLTLTQNLTYFTMGGYDDVDTSKYRNAIWMYIQSLYGIRHDDYNYAEVNVMLSREMKTFIKTMCCFPDRTTVALRQSVMVGFKSSEKVHVLLMIMEARLQAELIYFCRALVKLNNSSTIA